MSYVHPEYNPRMTGKKLRDNEQFDDSLHSSHTPYSGKPRNITTTRAKKGEPTERHTLTKEGAFHEEEAISSTASNLYGLTTLSHVLFTITLVALVGAQASTALTVKVLLILIVVHNFVSVFALGMHHKIEDKCAKSIDSEHKGLTLLRHVRNDRRSTLLFLSTLASCIAAIDIAYIARIAPSLDERADSFRQSGINTYTHRALDVLSILVFALAVPTALLIITEIRFGIQLLMRKAKVQDSEALNDGSDDEGEGPTIVSPK